MKIKRYGHGEGDFWSMMGPFFASAKVRRELGGAMSSDENYTWWVAIDDNSQVAGFVAVEIKDNKAVFHHGYVAPDHRDNQVYRSLFLERLKYTKDRVIKIKVTVAQSNVDIFLENGFVETKRNGQYHVLSWRQG